MPYSPPLEANTLQEKCKCQKEVEYDRACKASFSNEGQPHYNKEIFDFKCNVFSQNAVQIRENNNEYLKRSVYAFVYSTALTKPAVTCGFNHYVNVQLDELYREQLEQLEADSGAEGNTIERKQLRLFISEYVIGDEYVRNDIYNWKSCIEEELEVLNTQDATDAIAELEELFRNQPINQDEPLVQNDEGYIEVYKKACRVFRMVDRAIPEDQVWAFLIFIPIRLFNEIVEVPPLRFFPQNSFIYCIDLNPNRQDDLLKRTVEEIINHLEKEDNTHGQPCDKPVGKNDSRNSVDKENISYTKVQR